MGQMFSKTNAGSPKKKPFFPDDAAIEAHHQSDETLLDTVSTPEPKKFIDPRSPNICRTPIESLGSPETSITVTKALNLTTDEQNLSTPNKLVGTQKNFLQTKLLKNLGYQAFDPRSPTQFINRTPMRLDGAIDSNDQSFDSSLIDTSVPGVELPHLDTTSCTKESSDASVAQEDGETSIDQIIAELEIDPRSPSVNVERTPIVFSHTIPTAEDYPVVEIVLDDVENQTPTKHNIYQDEESATPASDAKITPRQTQTNEKAANNRTPLSCLGNKGRSALQSKNRMTKMPKHPILFIGQQQKNGGTPFGNSNNNSNSLVSSKIPVYKNSII